MQKPRDERGFLLEPKVGTLKYCIYITLLKYLYYCYVYVGGIQMNVRVSLDRYLRQNNLTAYRLSKEVAGKAAQGSIYALARGEKVKRVDLETLSEVMQALMRLTGQTVTPNDLLEVIEEPVSTEEIEAREWFDGAAIAMSDRLTEIEKDVPAEELTQWHESFKKAGKPVKYDLKKRAFVEQA
jgi:hypothetical protein